MQLERLLVIKISKKDYGSQPTYTIMVIPLITLYLHSISNGVSIPSSQSFGGDVIDGYYMNLSATEDSLYFVGNKGTFQMSKTFNTMELTWL
jgi:hypothetical protein